MKCRLVEEAEEVEWDGAVVTDLYVFDGGEAHVGASWLVVVYVEIVFAVDDEE